MSPHVSGIPKYLDLYGFEHPPFRLSPDPYFFFPAPTHAMAEKIILHALENNEGFMVLTGAAGLGKTLLLRLLLAEFNGVKIPAVILSSAVSPLGLLQLLLGELDVPYTGEESEAILLQRFQETVFHYAREGRDIFIVVDEAQNMPVATLEQLRMLSNIETGSRKLLQILLIGQEQLEETLRNQRLAQLVQRVIIHEKLHPLSRKETGLYVAFRLKRAGRRDIRLTWGAVWLLHGASGGVPRVINKIMDRTLLLAGAEIPVVISRRHVRSAVASMVDHEVAFWRRSRAPAAAVLGVAALLWLLSAFIPAGVLRQTWTRISKDPIPQQLQSGRKTLEKQAGTGSALSTLKTLNPSTPERRPSGKPNGYRIHPVIRVDSSFSGRDFKEIK